MYVHLLEPKQSIKHLKSGAKLSVHYYHHHQTQCLWSACGDCLRKSGAPLLFGAAARSPLLSEWLLLPEDRNLKRPSRGPALHSPRNRSVSSQWLSAGPWSLLLLLLSLSADDKPQSLCDWLKLCTDRDFPKLLRQSDPALSGLEESRSKGFASKLMCLVHALSAFKSGFCRNSTASLSSTKLGLTTTDGPSSSSK